MAVTQVTKPANRYVGLSTDTKPVGRPPLSTFYEIDTGNTYITDGTNWVPKVDSVSLAGSSIPRSALDKTELITSTSSALVIASGGNYTTAMQTIESGITIGVFSKVSASVAYAVNLYWYNDADELVGLDIVIANGVKQYGSGKTAAIITNKFKMQVINNQGADITLSALGYMVS